MSGSGRRIEQRSADVDDEGRKRGARGVLDVGGEGGLNAGNYVLTSTSTCLSTACPGSGQFINLASK